jgi:putative spermidine/putrescine transport system permease protein/spermidine/putrescine transport system permease protein
MLNNNISNESKVLEKQAPSLNKFKVLMNPQWLMILIPLIFVIVSIFVPMVGLFKMSIYDKNGYTAKYLIQVLTEPIYLHVIGYTLKVALIVTIICILLAYPVSFFIVKLQSKSTKQLLIQIIMIPFWISLLVRSFSWIVILQDKGIINTVLMNLHIIQKPLPLLYNTTGVVIGMTYVLLPYMILNTYSTMEGIDLNLLSVAQVMGAKPFKAFIQIFLPLSISGILSGSLLVFILALGYFITPALLGGAKDMMISTLIQNNISSTLNWSLASALSLVLFLIIILCLLVLLFVFKKSSSLKGVL